MCLSTTLGAPKMRFLARLSGAVAFFVFLIVVARPATVFADADDVASPATTSLGLQPISGPMPHATAAPGESRLFRRADGAYQAVPRRAGVRKCSTSSSAPRRGPSNRV